MVPSPPTPLILDGWHYSRDSQKKDRWLATLDWAKEFGFEDLIGDLNASEMYFAEEDSVDIPAYGEFINWSSEPRTRPSQAELVAMMERLRASWSEISDGLGSETVPVAFTGKKFRRLVVGVHGSERPPWGSWGKLVTGYDRSAFTLFRKRVNKEIVPHVVDHIDFKVEELDG